MTSLPNSRIIIPIGVTVKKNIIPITKGATIAPKSKPSLNHNLFGTINILGKKIPKKRKMKAIMQAQRRIFSLYHNGYKPIIVKTAAKTRPKLLSVPPLI